MTIRSAMTAILAGLALVLMAGALPASAELRVPITEGQLEPLPIAVMNFEGSGSPELVELGAKITEIVRQDLERSGLFKPIDSRAFIETSVAFDNNPRFGDWRLINAQALVVGRVDAQPNGEISVQFRLWDVFAEEHMTAKKFNGVPDAWRRMAHKVADTVYHRITGEEGYFDTRVVYIAESGPADRREKRLAIMDQDGANHRFLTDGADLVLTPRFSPTAQEITYLSYLDRKRPRVYLYNIDTGQQEVLGEFDGMTFAPRFAPSGNRVVMSLASSGNTEIYTMDLRTRRVTRLTNHPAIDTHPSYSPDGAQIVFESDRGGAQQLYVMNGDGSDVRRISFGDGRYATPVWSPRGDLIAFTKLHQGRFFIGVMKPDGSGERLLTSDFLVEGPTWAPNGRVLMFYRQTPSSKQGGGGHTNLFSIDLTGYNERRIPTPVDGSDPAWSPLLLQ